MTHAGGRERASALPSAERADRRRFDGRVVLITGAARGQGRSHALRFANEGADLILIDSVSPVDDVLYEMPASGALEETSELARALGARVEASVVDVRSLEAMAAAVDVAVGRLGRLDVVIANAGVLGKPALIWQIPEAQWDAVIGVNLKGVWATVKSCAGHLISAAAGASVVITGSVASQRGIPGIGDYVASKHGVLGLARTLANELGRYGIRVNVVLPTNVRTPMIDNPMFASAARPELAAPTLDDAYETLQRAHALSVPWVDVDDVTAAVTWLASDEARFVTGVALPVDAGLLVRH